MYLSNGWLGKGLEKDGHIRQQWSECKQEAPRQRRCDITFRVKFRNSLPEFLREAERAFGRWMTAGRARTLVLRRKDQLAKIHNEILTTNYSENAPVCLLGAITYRGLNGTWRVVDLVLQANMTFSKSQIEAGTAHCL